ncbi:alpha-amylase family glycosyl hydrolase [Gracilibacillus ureilyticus]|nr:alpha-amylase family glycosyl hydrolase [Gracilibacillus ureilyticus]
MNKIKKGAVAAIVCFILMIPAIPLHAADQLDERIYYILVDRFVNGNNENDHNINVEDPEAYHGGDIAGIIDKLPEIKQKGFSAINLSPIMVSESYHGFDTTDHQLIDEQFGTMEDLKELVEQAHEQDIKVILDFVISQVSSSHPFASAEQVGGYFDQSLSKLEITSESTSYINDAIKLWVEEAGVDGIHVYADEPENGELIDRITENLQDQAFVITEGTDRSGIAMNHDFQQEAVNLLSNPGESLEPLFDQEYAFTANGINYMESVLTSRFAFEAVREGYHPVTRWKLASTLLYTLPGSSLFYQGGEVPMDNGQAEPDHRMAELNKEDEEIIQHLEKLSQIRESSQALSEGELELVGQAGAMTVFKRTSAEETMYIAVNNDTKTQVVPVEDIDSDMQLTGLLEDDIVRRQDDGTYRIALERETSNIFIVEENKGINWFFITMMVIIFGGFVAFITALNIKVKHRTK